MTPVETPAGPAAAASKFAPELARLWAGVLLPPAGWVLDFLIRYMAIRYAHLHDRVWPLYLSTALGMTVVALGAWLCWQARQRAVGQHGGDPEARATAATLSSWGLALALFFFLLIAAQAYPVLVLTAREIT
jgi:hypothetical protein